MPRLSFSQRKDLRALLAVYPRPLLCRGPSSRAARKLVELELAEEVEWTAVGPQFRVPADRLEAALRASGLRA